MDDLPIYLWMMVFFFHTYVSLLEANVEQETFDEPRDEASPETWWIKL